MSTPRYAGTPASKPPRAMIVATTFLIVLEREIAGGQTGPAMEFLAGHTAETMRISVITFGELAEGYEDPASPRWMS